MLWHVPVTPEDQVVGEAGSIPLTKRLDFPCRAASSRGADHIVRNHLPGPLQEHRTTAHHVGPSGQDAAVVLKRLHGSVVGHRSVDGTVRFGGQHRVGSVLALIQSRCPGRSIQQRPLPAFASDDTHCGEFVGGVGDQCPQTHGRRRCRCRSEGDTWIGMPCPPAVRLGVGFRDREWAGRGSGRSGRRRLRASFSGQEAARRRSQIDCRSRDVRADHRSRRRGLPSHRLAQGVVGGDDVPAPVRIEAQRDGVDRIPRAGSSAVSRVYCAMSRFRGAIRSEAAATNRPWSN